MSFFNALCEFGYEITDLDNFLKWSIVEIQNDISNEVSRILMFLLIEIGLFSIRPYIDNYKNMEHKPTSKENALKF